MNQSLHFIFSRRSIRKFLADQEIPDALITDLLEAAMAAPSAVARDPWHFIVVRERGHLEQLAAILPHGKMLRQAAAALIVCGDITRAHDHQESYLLQDLSAAVENILLAATGLGLGSCWLGVHPRQERMDGIRALFHIPEAITPMCGIALGWPAEHPEPRTRFRSECVHQGRW
jgi:nitroreductase